MTSFSPDVFQPTRRHGPVPRYLGRAPVTSKSVFVSVLPEPSLPRPDASAKVGTMRFTRREILQMDESDLRMQVLKPLFTKMGFRDVFHHHGGSGEKGKDFVMWKLGDLGERVNYAVVAKATRMSGKADSGKGTAGTVATQVQQAFGADFLDPITTERQRVNFCWVVSSHEIPKEAEEGIKAVLMSSLLDRSVRFIGGDLLWKLICDHFPAHAALENIGAATDILENLDQDWRVTVSTKGGKRSFGLEAKHPNARSIPLKLKLSFPENPAGKAKLAALQEAWEKGTPLTVEAPYVSIVDAPEFMQSILGQGVSKFEWNPLPPNHPVPVQLRIRCDDGLEFAPSVTELRPVRGGSKEALVSNRHEGKPWVIDALLTLPKGPVTFSFSFKLGKQNAHLLYEAAQLWRAITRSGVIEMTHANTGIRIFDGPLSSKRERKGPDERLLSLLEDLDFLQRTTHLELFLPDGDFTESEAASARQVAELLRCGRAKLVAQTIATHVDYAEARRAIINWNDGKVGALTTGSPDHTTNVFGTPISLGPVALFMSSVRLSAETIAEVTQADKLDQKPETIAVKFEPSDICSMELFSLDAVVDDPSIPAEVRNMATGGLIDHPAGHSGSLPRSLRPPCSGGP